MNTDWCMDESHPNIVCQLAFGHRGHHKYKDPALTATWMTIVNDPRPAFIRVADQYPACNLERMIIKGAA